MASAAESALGDIISIDCNKKTLELEVDDATTQVRGDEKPGWNRHGANGV